jgi:hypothetical protein
MAEIARQIGTTNEQLAIRLVRNDNAQSAIGVTASSPDLEFWYWREGSEKVVFTPVALTALDDPWTAGGFLEIANGYYRLDLPNAIFAAGVTDVQIGGGDGTNLTMIGVSVRLQLTSTAYVPGVESGLGELLPCDLLLQEAPAPTRDGCPVRSRRRHVPVQQGVCGTVIWTMRTPEGRVVNLTNCLTLDSLSGDSLSGSLSESSDRSLAVRFRGCDRGCVVAEVTATVLDAATGRVQFEIPEEVCQNPGIYQFQVAVLDGNRPLFIDTGLLSIEASLWGDEQRQGSLTIGEIRNHLRDYAAENSLLGEVEFTDDEILDAIGWPVRQWNETPPPIGTFSCNNFPFRFHWRNAVVGQLLKTAAHSYLRNKLQTASGGLSVDDKNKNAEYLQFAMLYEQEWKEFIKHKKAQINAGMFMGSIGGMRTW